jgi:hypothetical protein
MIKSIGLIFVAIILLFGFFQTIKIVFDYMDNGYPEARPLYLQCVAENGESVCHMRVIDGKWVFVKLTHKGY